MKLLELHDEKNAIKRLVRIIHFNTNPKETRIIQQRLRDKGINPTLTEIKRQLMKYLLSPLEEIPEPERTVIQRYKNREN